MLSIPGRKDIGFLVGACVLIPLMAAVLVARNPVFGLVLLLAIGVLLLASRSIVYPVALGGIPALLIGLNGTNPLPGKVVFISLTAWLVCGLGFAFASGLWPSSAIARKVLTPPFLLTLGLTMLVIARLDPGTYPKTKVELFLAQGPTLLAAGILIANRARSFWLYLVLSLLSAVADGAVLTDKLTTGQATQAASARLTISTTYNPILAGRDAAVGVLIAVAFVLLSRSRRSSLLAYAALPLLGTALLASGSRGPVVALLIALVVLVALVLQDQRVRSRLLRVSAAILVAIVVVAAIVPGDAIHRSTSFLFGSTSDLSSNGRTHLWLHALSLFGSHFWTGVGTGGFAVYEPIYQYPHDIVLEAAAEQGVLGAALVIAFLYLALRTAFRAWSLSVEREDRILTALVAAMLCAAVANSLLSDALESTSTIFLTTGLAYGLYIRLREKVPAERSLTPAIPTGPRR